MVPVKARPPLLAGGLAFTGTIDHTTALWVTCCYTAIFGLGLGLLMQNLVLAVQNTVRAQDIGTASASVAFFRSVGGAIGVSVLGAIMATHVKDLATQGFAAAHIPVSGGSGDASMDLTDLPAPIRDIMRAAYGDATAQIFMISAVIAVVAFLAVLFIKEVPLRKTVDASPEKELLANASGEAAMTLDTSALPVIESAGFAQAADDGGTPLGASRARAAAEKEHDELDLEFARILTQERPDPAAGLREVQDQLARTQRLLAEQQLQLSRAQRELQARVHEQQATAVEQSRIAEELAALRKELKRERRRQERAALLLLAGDASRAGETGRHAG